MIICCEVLEHSTIPTQLLTELRRTIRKNGVIILSVPNEQVLCHRKQLSKYEYSHAGDTHINFFTPYSLEKLLFRTGLEIVSMKTIYPPSNSVRSFLGNIKNSIKKSFSGSFIVCILRPMEDPWIYWETFYKNLRS
jgi:2-polyprenyl-3-methyl-5-hydroxy-6-metoxy-1,4-benzoquinol methylase